MRISKIILRILGYLLLAPPIAVAWLGVLRLDLGPQFAAQLILEFIGPILFLILLVGALMTYRRWRKSGGRAFLAAFLVVASAVLTSGFTLGGYIAAGLAHGATINPLATLWPKLPGNATAVGEAHAYDRFDGEAARLYVNRPSGGRTGPAPVLVYIHGGGWVQGSASQRNRDVGWFADQGYLVVSVDYALSSADRHLWNVTQPQIACALAWIGRNAERFGGDPGRIAMFGESAGANLVLNIGNLVNANQLASRCDGAIPRIGAVISIYPPVDMAALHAHPAATQYAAAYTGGTPARFPDRYKAVSPIESIGVSNPPLLLVTGLDDSLVPVRDTLLYAQRAKQAGLAIDLIAIPRAGHGFDAIPGSIGNQIVRSTTLKFLGRNGLAP